MKILVTGASGSGTTTLAHTLASVTRAEHLDLDDYYRLPTTPPYRDKRDAAKRLEMLTHDCKVHDSNGLWQPDTMGRSV